MNLDKTEIETALAGFSEYRFEEAARLVLSVLGYRSERVPPEQSGEVEQFINTYPAKTRNTKSEQFFRENVKSVRILFQMTDSEIEALTEQGSLFSGEGFDKGNVKSFMFATVQTGGGVAVSRGTYANIAREINKRFSMPTVVLFKTSSNLFSLAFVERRPHKRDPNRDVLGRVSLVREIDTREPHRAHLDILYDLSLDKRIQWINAKGKGQNFDGLLSAWLDALDTEELNQKFYRQLFTWFERAVEEAKFPTQENQNITSEEHIIRLITRLLFVWFIKEKGLVAPELFDEEQIKYHLKNYDRDYGDSYYRVVLQNLFFATLNTQIDKRVFSKEEQSTHRDFFRYRYKDEIADIDGLLVLFSKTPFINGGLFDCLDSFENYTAGGYRIDCFTDNINDPSKREYQMVSVPNRLFFDDDGLITLFDRYKFTIEESTPVEQEVALDPELLGKVFENLLAAYNPETRETVRKSTGSYYTPTAVVNYMVDESLIESLAEKVTPFDGEVVFWRERLRYLFDYEDACNDAFTLFMQGEREELVQSIAEMKIIDPAVGSGAFPIAILHKMNLALRRLDPDNTIWERVQRKRALCKAEKAFATADYERRGDELAEINEIFEVYRYSDYGRKIYLIQNSIFGVDIQLIACQIAKLRFFISLAIEQNLDRSKKNFGIRPLPNLETHILAADTLIPLERPKQRELQSMEVLQLEHEIAENRERYYHANTRNQKWDIIIDFENLRLQFVDVLKESGFSADASEKIVSWSPYDQNSRADWFDPEYMFGIPEGFDIVIGNPPYIQLQKDGGKLGNRYKDIGYTTFIRSGDIYQLFYEKGCQLLKSGHGILSFITSNSWLRSEYGKLTRNYFVRLTTPLLLLEMGKDIFQNAIVDTNILILRNDKSSDIGKAVDMDRLSEKDIPNIPPKAKWLHNFRPQLDRPWSILSRQEKSIAEKMERYGDALSKQNLSINSGIKTGCNKVFIIDERTKNNLIQKDNNSADIIKPILRGRDIERYLSPEINRWLIDTHTTIEWEKYQIIKDYLDQFYTVLSNRTDRTRTPYNLRSCSYYADFDQIKLIWMGLTNQARFSYASQELFILNSAFMMIGEDSKYLCSILNSKIITWWMSKMAPNSGMGVTQWTPSVVKEIPVPILLEAERVPFIDAVDNILQKKNTDRMVDISAEEAKIDQLVYELYGLTKDEIALVESW